MLKVVLDVAPPDQFSFSPLLIIALLAPIALAVAVFWVRFRRKGDK